MEFNLGFDLGSRGRDGGGGSRGGGGGSRVESSGVVQVGCVEDGGPGGGI